MTNPSSSILFCCPFCPAHPLPIALSLDEDLMGVMREPVEERVGEERIVKEPIHSSRGLELVITVEDL